MVIPFPQESRSPFYLGQWLNLSGFEWWAPSPIVERGQVSRAAWTPQKKALPSEIQPLLHLIPGLEVQTLHLREASTEGHTFAIPGGHPDGPDHIHIPAGEVRRLLGKGG